MTAKVRAQDVASGIGRGLRRAARCDLGNDRQTQIRVPTTAIGKQEHRKPTDRIEVRSVDDQPSALLACDEAGALQDREMGRKSVLRHGKRLRQFAGRQPVRQPRNQASKGFQPCGLGQSRKRECREG